LSSVTKELTLEDQDIARARAPIHTGVVFTPRVRDQAAHIVSKTQINAIRPSVFRVLFLPAPSSVVCRMEHQHSWWRPSLHLCHVADGFFSHIGDHAFSSTHL
jgi:hypothetical protein